jgi:hypothetical protein
MSGRPRIDAAQAPGLAAACREAITHRLREGRTRLSRAMLQAPRTRLPNIVEPGRLRRRFSWESAWPIPRRKRASRLLTMIADASHAAINGSATTLIVRLGPRSPCGPGPPELLSPAALQGQDRPYSLAVRRALSLRSGPSSPFGPDRKILRNL